jgi:hypothetical protein
MHRVGGKIVADYWHWVTKMVVDKYGSYVRKLWQLCGWGIVDICMTFHMRAFDCLYTIAH